MQLGPHAAEDRDARLLGDARAGSVPACASTVMSSRSNSDLRQRFLLGSAHIAEADEQRQTHVDGRRAGDGAAAAVHDVAGARIGAVVAVWHAAIATAASTSSSPAPQPSVGRIRRVRALRRPGRPSPAGARAPTPASAAGAPPRISDTVAGHERRRLRGAGVIGVGEAGRRSRCVESTPIGRRSVGSSAGAARRHQRHDAGRSWSRRDRCPLGSTAPTVMTPSSPAGESPLRVDAEVARGGDDDRAGGERVVDRRPAALAEQPAPPKLMLMTSAGVGIVGHAVDVQAGRPADGVGDVAVDARCRASTPSTRTEQERQLQSSPATPRPLLLSAPMMPATCVPCSAELPSSESPGSVGSASRPSPSAASSGR